MVKESQERLQFYQAWRDDGLNFWVSGKSFPEVCGLQNIPANKITGTACEEQIINALYAYQYNIPLLKEVLAHIKNIKRHEPKNPYRMLKGVQLGLSILQSQNEEALVVKVFFKLFCRWYMHISQISVQRNPCVDVNHHQETNSARIEQIRRVGQVSKGIIYPHKNVMKYLISTLDTGSFAHTAVSHAHTVVYCYCFEQYVDTLCTLLRLMNPYCGGSCEYIVSGAELLHNACCVGVDYKIQMGEMGIIQSNVSEVQSQRTQLINKDFIMAVRFMLQYSYVKLDVDTSIRCVYILKHMLSFQLDKWLDESISPFDVLAEVKNVMFSWDVRAKRKISSLLPIFTLLECEAIPKEESQYVSAWILCSLTTVNAEVYCDMLRRENGEEIIRRVYSSLGEDQEKTRKLLSDIMLNMKKFFRTNL